MRRIMTALALTAICSMGISAAFAGGPGCTGGAKTADAGKSCSKSASSCSSSGGFPTMVRMVGDKEVGCPMTAEKMAKEQHAKVVFAVAGEKFDTEPAAWVALADASERYVQRYTAVACVADGKTYYVCDEAGKCCSAQKTASCSKGGEAKTAAAGSSCHGKSEVKTASAEGKSCCKDKAKMASEKSDGCCASKGEKVAVIDSKACAEICKSAKEVKYMVAGHEFPTMDAAGKARGELIAAIHTVKMTYVVDGQEVDCASKVCPKAKEAGKVKYVVGDKQLQCEYMARVELAKAQYDAAKQVSEKKLAKI